MLSKQLLLTPANAKTMYYKGGYNIIDFQISPDQSYIAAYYVYSQIVIWKMNTQYKQFELTATMRQIQCLEISFNSKYIAIGGNTPSVIQIWKVKNITNKSVTLRHHLITVDIIRFNKCSKQLLSISRDKQLAIWDRKAQTLIKLLKLLDDNSFLINHLNISTFAQLCTKNSKKCSLESNLNKKYSHQKLQFEIFFHLLAQIIPCGFQILSNNKRILRSKKKLTNLQLIQFMKGNKFIYAQFETGAIIVFSTTTMKMLQYIPNEFHYSQIKLAATDSRLSIVACNMFGIKQWDSNLQ